MWLDNKTGRLVSLDFMRGLIMVLLMLEYLFADKVIWTTSSHWNFTWILYSVRASCLAWSSLWDMIQPGFMYIAGVGMAFCPPPDRTKGKVGERAFQKPSNAGGWLFFWGVLDYAVRETTFLSELWDVLTQLSFTTLVTFLVFEWKIWISGFSLSWFIGTDGDIVPVYEHSRIRSAFHGSTQFWDYVGSALMNKINAGGWVAPSMPSQHPYTLSPEPW